MVQRSRFCHRLQKKDVFDVNTEALDNHAIVRGGLNGYLMKLRIIT
jgi:hypothetical protein